MSDEQKSTTMRRAFNILDTLIIGALLGVGGLIVNLNNSMIALSSDVKALTQQQIALQTQLGELPNVRAKLAEYDVRIKRNSDDIQELRAMKGLR